MNEATASPGDGPEEEAKAKAKAEAKAALEKARAALADAADDALAASAGLRSVILAIRPTGVLTVDQMAAALLRDRNYVDRIWAQFGDTRRYGLRTRVTAEASAEDRAEAVQRLTDAANVQRAASASVKNTRTARDLVVAEVYRSKVLGPSRIAEAVDVDRNHVLRLARKARVAPAWRQDGAARNQYSPRP